MATSVTTFLMFQGKAEEAINFYVSVFEGAEIRDIKRYGPGEAGAEDTVRQARFALCGQEFTCIDSPVPHDFTFTPSISLFVECDSEAELNTTFERLAEDGEVLMPLDSYGFSTRFGWVNDQFGVSWQLNLT